VNRALFVVYEPSAYVYVAMGFALTRVATSIICRHKKIHCLVVRGAYFCPTALDCLSDHLGVTKNCMIMGVPDMKFQFPFARLNGVRLAVATPDPVLTAQTTMHMYDVLAAQFASEQATRRAQEMAVVPAEGVWTEVVQEESYDGKNSEPSVTGKGNYEV
jgi:hypothetical protein